MYQRVSSRAATAGKNMGTAHPCVHLPRVGRVCTVTIAESPTATGVGLDPTWWVRGLDLTGRAGADAPARAEPDGGLPGRRLARWRALHGTGTDWFAVRLADAGLDEAGLLALLAEAPDDLAARRTRPAWAAFVESAVAAADEPAIGSGLTWLDGFGTVLAPFVRAATDRYTDGLPDVAADRAALRDGFADRLRPDLVRLAARTLVLELNVRRVTGTLYGDTPHGATRVRPQRDRAEVLLMRAAVEAGKPLLGICRGMQLMAVAYGGRLHQHLPDVLGHHGHRPASGPKFGHHTVEMVPGTRIHDILGDRIVANSFHHQGVKDPGRLTATGWCPEDELIEVVEDPALPFALGVQWHPEDTDDFRVIAALIEAAAKQKALAA